MELTDAERDRIVYLIRNVAVTKYGENGQYHDERGRVIVPKLKAQLLATAGLGCCFGNLSNQADVALAHKFDEQLPRAVKEQIVDEALSDHLMKENKD